VLKKFVGYIFARYPVCTTSECSISLHRVLTSGWKWKRGRSNWLSWGISPKNYSGIAWMARTTSTLKSRSEMRFAYRICCVWSMISTELYDNCTRTSWWLVETISYLSLLFATDPIKIIRVRHCLYVIICFVSKKIKRKIDVRYNSLVNNEQIEITEDHYSTENYLKLEEYVA